MINFIHNWGGVTDRRKNWSGTPYGLQKSLEKIMPVNDVELITYPQSIMEKIVYTMKYWKDLHVIADSEAGAEQINESAGIKEGAPCFMFLEYISRYIRDSYIYQDCSFDYCVRMSKYNPKLALYSPLPRNASPYAIRKRLYMANDFYRKCKGIFTMSGWLADDLVKNTKIPINKVHYVGGGCNIDISAIDHSMKTGNRFLFVGRGWRRKNGPLVVEAFKKLHKKYSDVELYIAGPVEQPMEIQKQENIIFLGNLDYSELVQYYNLCDYFVMPSNFEAYGIVFAEALTFGLPCIGKNCFAMPEFIEDGRSGILIKNNDSGELLSAMEHMLKTPSMSEYVQGKQLFYKDYYSWDAVARRIAEVLIRDGYDIQPLIFSSEDSLNQNTSRIGQG